MATMPSSKLVVGTLIPLLVCMIWALCAPAAAADYTLISPDVLPTGKSLVYGNYKLIMQSDCNLVLYDGGDAVWASQTHHKGSNCFLAMQSDGNLVIYTGSGSPVWASNTAFGQANYIFILQPDRNLVIYGPAIWASNTHVHGAGVTVAAPNVANETLIINSI